MMSIARFQRCLDFVLRHEGGYVDHPRDPGGATNMGITFATLAGHRGRPVTKQDVKDLTKREAAAIYETRYWDTVRAGSLPAGIDLVTFDPAVNSGPRRGATWLQRAMVVSGMPVTVDGAVGTETINACNAAARAGQAANIVKRACQARMSFLRALGTFDVFGRGWTRRVAEVEATGVRWAHEATNMSPAQVAAQLRNDAATAQTSANQSQNAARTGTVAAPAGGVGLDQVAEAPAWGTTAFVVICVVVVIAAALKTMQHRERKRAYDRAVQGVTT